MCWIFPSSSTMKSFSVRFGIYRPWLSVTDSHGRYIPNLTENDFIVEEDGTIQHISHFSQDRNVLDLSVLFNNEVILGQIRNISAVAIGDRDDDVHQPDVDSDLCSHNRANR